MIPDSAAAVREAVLRIRSAAALQYVQGELAVRCVLHKGKRHDDVKLNTTIAKSHPRSAVLAGWSQVATVAYDAVALQQYQLLTVRPGTASWPELTCFTPCS